MRGENPQCVSSPLLRRIRDARGTCAVRETVIFSRSLELTPMRKEEIACYNAKSASTSKEAQRVDRENRQRLRKEEIARFSLAPCHHMYAWPFWVRGNKGLCGCSFHLSVCLIMNFIILRAAVSEAVEVTPSQLFISVSFPWQLSWDVVVECFQKIMII